MFHQIQIKIKWPQAEHYSIQTPGNTSTFKRRGLGPALKFGAKIWVQFDYIRKELGGSANTK